MKTKRTSDVVIITAARKTGFQIWTLDKRLQKSIRESRNIQCVHLVRKYSQKDILGGTMNSKNILDHFIELTDPREDNKRHEQETINIDRKTLCRSHGKGKSAIHMVSAWANKAGLTIGQVMK